MALPTGIVTFLFTDIEGSTRLWEQRPEEMQRALALHDDVLREAITANGGVVFKTIGDAFCAVFPHAPGAVACALASQCRLISDEIPELPLKVRMAIHAGEAQLRDGDYFGMALSLVARLLSSCHGRQVVLSSGAEALARECLPDGANLRDLGAYRLRGVQQPERVWQLVHPDLPANLPPLRSLSALSNNLPQQLTSFVGREEEMAAVSELLSSFRLVTLTGSGGCGKTRLALQVAEEALESYPDGVWLIELAELTDSALVPAAVASTLQVPEEPARTVMDTLADSLRPKAMVLLLDNCEHVVESTGRLIEGILRSCPNVRVLATSREPLNIPGEHCYRVPSLETPDPASIREAAHPEEYAVIRLFRDRAQASNTGFTLTRENAAAAAQICRRLDGIPLAIELAAARARSLPLSQIASRLDDRFSLLTRGSRTALPRQQTLRATVDWSWDLLTCDEQTVLRRASVFSGGFALEAAESVCADPDSGMGPEGIGPADVLDLLTQLIDKSLVVMDDRLDGPRYRLLETVREYCIGKLAESGEQDALKRHHFDWAMAIAQEASRRLDGPQMQEWLDRLELEHANLRTALSFTQAGDGSLRMALALHRFWLVRGYLTEGRELQTAALEAAGECESVLRAKVLNNVGVLEWRQGDFAAARRHLTAGLELRQRAGDRSGAAAALNNLGMLADDEGDHSGAGRFYEEAAAIYRDIGDRPHLGMVLANLGANFFDLGDLDSAESASREFLQVAEEMKDPWNTATAYHNLGEIALQRGDLESAIHPLRRALRSLAELGDTPQVVQLLMALGRTALGAGDTERAVQILSATRSILAAEHVFLRSHDLHELEDAESLARSMAAAGDLAAWWDRGHSLDLSAAVQLALAEPGGH